MGHPILNDRGFNLYSVLWISSQSRSRIGFLLPGRIGGRTNRASGLVGPYLSIYSIRAYGHDWVRLARGSGERSAVSPWHGAIAARSVAARPRHESRVGFRPEEVLCWILIAAWLGSFGQKRSRVVRSWLPGGRHVGVAVGGLGLSCGLVSVGFVSQGGLSAADVGREERAE